MNAADATPARTSAGPQPKKCVGRFVVESTLGEGAQGEVFRAFDPLMDRPVALKVPRFQGHDPDERARFLHEAQATARLRHPHLVTVYESGEADGLPYLASEFISGETLAAYCQERRVDSRQVAEWVRQLADALDYAHSLGIVHGDVKPANVMVDSTRQLRLMDFGLAAELHAAPSPTDPNAIVGSPAYMSPERIRGKCAADAADDQYSLGVLLYELLTRELPFHGEPHIVVRRILQEEPDRPRSKAASVPRDLEVICLKCLSKEARGRYASCRDLADDLDRWLQGRAIVARKTPIWERAARWAKKSPMIAGLTLGAAVLLVSIISVSVGVALKLRSDRLAISDALETAKAEFRRASEQAQLAAAKQAEAQEKSAHAVERAQEAQRLERETAEALAQRQQTEEKLAATTNELDSQSKELSKMQNRELAAASSLKQMEQSIRQRLDALDEWSRYRELLKLTDEAIESNKPEQARTWLELCATPMRDLAWNMRKARLDSPGTGIWTAPAENTFKNLAAQQRYRRLLPEMVRISFDGLLLAAVSQPQTLAIYETRTGRLLQNLKVPESTRDRDIRRISFDATSSQVSIATPSEAAVWEAADGKLLGHHVSSVGEILLLTARDAGGLCILVRSPDNKSASLRTAESGAVLKNLPAGTAAFLRDLRGPAKLVRHMQVSIGIDRAGRRMAVTQPNDRNVTAAFFDLAEGVQSPISPQMFLSNQSLREPMAVFSADGQWCVFRSDRNFIAESATGKAQKISATFPLAISPGGRHLVDKQGIWDIKHDSIVLPIETWCRQFPEFDILVGDPKQSKILDLDWSHDGSQIAVVAMEGIAVLNLPKLSGASMP